MDKSFAVQDVSGLCRNLADFSFILLPKLDLISIISNGCDVAGRGMDCAQDPPVFEK